MPLRPQQCCPNVSGAVSHSLFWINVVSLLSVALLVSFYFSLSPRDLLPRRPSSQTDFWAKKGSNVGGNKFKTEAPELKGNVSPPRYRYILNEPFKCRDDVPFLVVVIATRTGEADARNAIRQAWGNESMKTMGKGFIRLFLIGREETSDTSLQKSIEEESQVHHDILQQDFLDTYYNLTIKTLMGVQWVASYCPNATYVMKTDSDMFVNIESLIKRVLQPELPPKQKFFTGQMRFDDGVIRNKESKWYMPPELYPRDRYPPYSSGSGYVFSGDVARLVYEASFSLPILHLEDVYMGLCLEKAGIKPVAPPPYVFNNGRVHYDSCKYNFLVTSHSFPPKDIIRYWNHLQNNKNKGCVQIT